MKFELTKDAQKDFGSEGDRGGWGVGGEGLHFKLLPVDCQSGPKGGHHRADWILYSVESCRLGTGSS